MAKTKNRKTAPRSRAAAAHDRGRSMLLEARKNLRREREIIKVTNQLDRARQRSVEVLRQFAIDYLEELGFTVDVATPPAAPVSE